MLLYTKYTKPLWRSWFVVLAIFAIRSQPILWLAELTIFWNSFVRSCCKWIHEPLRWCFHWRSCLIFYNYWRMMYNGCSTQLKLMRINTTLPGNRILAIIPGKTSRNRGKILIYAHRMVPAFAWSNVFPARALWTMTYNRCAKPCMGTQTCWHLPSANAQTSISIQRIKSRHLPI